MSQTNGQSHHCLNIILFGPPGCGKGTQAKFLVKNHGFTHVSTGDILRNEIRQGTALGKIADGYMRQGLLVPDAHVGEMVKKKVQDLKAQNACILFDGYPRTRPQAEQVDAIFRQVGLTLHGVVALMLDPEVLINRIRARRTCGSCGTIVNLLVDNIPEGGGCPVCGGVLTHRADDNEEVVRTRMQGYRSEMEPLLTYYERRGMLYSIDALGTVEEVAQRVAGAIRQIEADVEAREKLEEKEKV